MTIHLHIERLVLEGLPLEKRHGPQVQAAVEAELARLLAAGGLALELQAAAAVPRRPAEGIQLGNESHPARLGQQIAQSVYGGIGRGNEQP